VRRFNGVYITFDIYSRYRLKGRDVLFVCGGDEHGVAISMKAKRITPQVIDKYDELYVNRLLILISHLIITRTSAKIHHDTASEFLPLYMKR
jgi:methionyl-tRNA synthetase